MSANDYYGQAPPRPGPPEYYQNRGDWRYDQDARYPPGYSYGPSPPYPHQDPQWYAQNRVPVGPAAEEKDYPRGPRADRRDAPGPRPKYANLQWTAPPTKKEPEPVEEEDANPFRPSKALQVEDQTEKKDGTKVSFAFKTKQSSRPRPPQEEPRLPEDGRPRDVMTKISQREKEAKAWNAARSQAPLSPEMRTEKRIRKRPKRALSPTLADSTSIYYRKPGNESVVGSGTYGKVFKAIHVYTKKLAALKKIRMDGEKDGFPVTAVREIKLLQSLKHENIVSLQEVMVEHNDCFMVFEYLSHDLTGLLNHPTFVLSSAHRKHLALQLFEGLAYLHRRGVLHRDIKAANILVSSEGQLKLADFGLARFYSKRGSLDYTNRVITIWYRSPELLLGETQYGPAVDIWSAACVMVEIFTRHAIFPGDGGEINQLDKIYQVLGTPSTAEWPGLTEMAWFELLRPTEKRASNFAEKYRDRVSAAAFDLLAAMFAFDPNKRPSANDVLAHPYFASEEPAAEQAIE